MMNSEHAEVINTLFASNSELKQDQKEKQGLTSMSILRHRGFIAQSGVNPTA
jgi:hypothetical protein